ncbi:hypothetical protein ACMZ52_27090 [Klebsiella pneumoniae]
MSQPAASKALKHAEH